MNNIIESLMIALLITITVECLLSVALGVRTIRGLLLVALINIVTNPPVNIFLDVLYYKAPCMINIFTVTAVELCVVIAEALIYNGRLNTGRLRSLLFSAILNGASFAAGMLISLF